MRRTGLIGVVVAVLVGLLFAVVIPALTPRDKDLMTVYVNTSAVGSGVGHGTDVMLRGAAVGKVSDLKVNEDGSARITMELRKHLVDGMGKDFGLDFRPKNYFGITGITITDPGTREAGLLADGTRVERRDAADYSMATMLERGSDVANGVLMTSAAFASVISWFPIVLTVAVVLFEKGIPLGTALAFMMAMAALSLPEAIMLRRTMKLPLIALFFGITTVAIMATGYLINSLNWLQ